MKRLTVFLLAIVMGTVLTACGAGRTAASAVTPAPIETEPPLAVETPAEPEPTEPPAATEPPSPAVPELPAADTGWSEAYLAFLDDNYDILAALWPDGITGVGFIDLDLDGVPEMLLFDQGASATLGVQLFDQVGGEVYCVSSTLDGAWGAFDGTYRSRVSVCASFFEAFRLGETENGFTFWVTSANGTMETAWDEVVAFGSEDGALTLVSVCSRWLETDPETGVVVEERYFAGDAEADETAYRDAAALYTEARDAGYDGKGVFLWNDMQSYDITYEGLLAMAGDAVRVYVPIETD